MRSSTRSHKRDTPTSSRIDRPTATPARASTRLPTSPGPVRDLARHAAALVLGLLLLLLVPAAARADGPPLLVLPGTHVGMSEQEIADIVEESAYVADELGTWTVYRWYQLSALTDPVTEQVILACGGDPVCLFTTSDTLPVEYILIVDIVRADQVVVHYRTMDVVSGRVLADQYAYLPTATDFPWLLAPATQALTLSPTVAPIPPVARAPAPAPAPAPVQPAPQADETLGELGQIGVWSAAGGVALLAGGVLLGFSADDVQQEIQAKPHRRTELESLQSQGETQQTLANVAFGLGTAAVITGVVLYFLDDGPEPTTTVGTAPTRGGAWVGFGARF